MAYGTVTNVGADTFFSGDPTASQASPVPLPSSAAGGDAFYVGQVSIDRLELRDVPDNFHVTPGMTVTADIKVGKRTVLEYFMSRIIPIATESLREPGN
jgi:HlyD family secretion protein